MATLNINDDDDDKYSHDLERTLREVFGLGHCKICQWTLDDCVCPQEKKYDQTDLEDLYDLEEV